MLEGQTRLSDGGVQHAEPGRDADPILQSRRLCALLGQTVLQLGGPQAIVQSLVLLAGAPADLGPQQKSAEEFDPDLGSLAQKPCQHRDRSLSPFTGTRQIPRCEPLLGNPAKHHGSGRVHRRPAGEARLHVPDDLPTGRSRHRLCRAPGNRIRAPGRIPESKCSPIQRPLHEMAAAPRKLLGEPGRDRIGRGCQEGDEFPEGPIRHF
jgi:hypothetical protein